MIAYILLPSILMFGCIFSESKDDSNFFQPTEVLIQAERNRIWDELHFAIFKMEYFLDKAAAEASLIIDIDIQNATVGIIDGAIAGIATKSGYGIVIGGALGAMGKIAGDAYLHFFNSWQNVKDAKYWAFVADELQERLWRDY